MTLKEKALVAMMKRDYKRDGYQLRIGGPCVEISGDGWSVRCEEDQLPRQVAGLIVVHCGYRLADGAYLVDGTGCQSLLDPAASRIQAAEGPSAGLKIDRTALKWGGLEIWQRELDKKIFLVSPSRAGIVENVGYEPGYMVQEDDGLRIRFSGECSDVVIVPEEIDETTQYVMDSLEKIRWV